MNLPSLCIPGGPRIVSIPAERTTTQRAITDLFARFVYGSIPKAPDRVTISRKPMAGTKVEHIRLDLGRFHVDAALWLPDSETPAPLIVGLDFLGPAGNLISDAFPLDPSARIFARDSDGAPVDRLSESLRGTTAYRWPIDLLRGAGFAVMTSCYGSWVPDCPTSWRDTGVFPLVRDDLTTATGAISLWAWSIQRMIDAAEHLSEIDAMQVHVVGHSRLGKAALWASAHDPRIQSVFANQSGCLGAAPRAHPVGETVAQLQQEFHHWSLNKPIPPQIDQHHLLALSAPRAVYLGQADADTWADPHGSVAALQAAAPFWLRDDPPIGHHIRSGGHDLLPEDWGHYLRFLQTL